jgi:hypothetical protein
MMIVGEICKEIYEAFLQKQSIELVNQNNTESVVE